MTSSNREDAEFQEFIALMKELIITQRNLVEAIHILVAHNQMLADAQDDADDDLPRSMSRKQ